MKNEELNRILRALGAAIALGAAVQAQDLVPKAGPQERPVLIRHATVHTVAGDVLHDADLLFDAGVIRAVRSGRVGSELVEGAEVVDARDKHVYPGFVCVASTLGLSEIGAVDMTVDTSEAGTQNPEVVAAVAVNPDSWLFPVARRNGVLTAGVMPQGGVVPGRASVLRLDGWTWEDMALERDAGLVVNWPFMGSGGRGRFFGRRFGGGGEGASAEETIAQLDALLDAAAAYGAARAADVSVKTDLRLEALAPTLSGATPVFVNAASLEQIESAVAWAARRGLRIVLVGGRDANQCLELLKRHDVAVAVTAVHRMPHRRDLSYASTYELPSELEAAGVRWCLTMPAREGSNVRNLPYEAAAAVAYGLDRTAALRSITLSAAECLGVAERLGSIEVGKAATLFVADGDPFELTTQIEAAFIDGRRIDLRDKQTELDRKYREKYRQLGK